MFDFKIKKKLRYLTLLEKLRINTNFIQIKKKNSENKLNLNIKNITD